MSNRKTALRIAAATLAMVIISSVTFASPWSAAMDWLGLGQPVVEPAAPAPDVMTIGTCDTAGPIEVEASLTGPGPTAYATLGAAFTAINAGTHTGAISVEVCGNTTEAASATLNASGAGSASYSVVIMRPSGGVARTVSGSVAGPLIDLNGADNVTINGINTGGDALTIENTLSASTPSAIRFIADATGNTVQNSTIKSAETSTTLGTIFFSTGTATGNDSNIITNNTITSSGSNFATNAIYSSGTSTAIDNGAIQVTNNNISDYFNAASVTAGINVTSTGNSGWTITGNKLFQSATRIYTTANTHSGILVGGGQGYTISNNTIGFANSAGTGITNIVGNSVALTGTFPSSYTTTGTATATRYIAINAAFTAAGTVSNIQNNTIAGFALYTSSGATTTNGIWCGIQVLGGNANIGTTTGNTIGAASSSIYTAGTTAGGLIAGIYATSANTVSIQNNTIQNFDAMGTTASLSGSVNGINSAGVGNFDISGNTIGNATNPNFRMGTLTTGANLSNAGTTFGAGTGASIFQGVLNSASGTVTIGTVSLPNTIRNASANSTSTSARVAGIQTSAGTNTIDSNSIFNLTTPSANTSTSSSPAAVGIHLVIGGLTHAITRNTIRDISSTAASAVVYVDGVYIGSTPAATISKNSIFNLTTASTSTSASINGILLFNSSATINIHNNMMRLGLGVGNNPIIRGVYDNTATGSPTNILFNSIYIDGTQGAATVNTACIKKDLASTMTITDNILWNNRASTGAPASGAGRHYGIQVVSAAGNPTSNYNDIYTPNNGGTIGLASVGTDQVTLANWRTATSQDLNSQNADPQFIDATNATTPNLHINPSITTLIEGNGILVSPPTDDFDGQTRASFTPVDIGADAGNFIGVDLTPPVITYTALANTTLTTDRTLSITVTDATGVPTAGIGLPVIYYKKNAGSYTSTQCTSTGGSSYSCNLLSASLGGLAATDTVSYYVAAQDTAATPNVTTNPSTGASGFTANPPAASTPTAAPSSYLIAAAFTGTKTVCASGCDYTTLTGATGIFNALNTGVATGNITIQINGDLTVGETGAVALNALAEEPAASNYTVKLYPTGGARAISGAVSSNALVRLNGADRVTIDGSIGGVGTDRSLTITNTATTNPTAISIGSPGLGAGATFDTVKNCNISTGSNTATSSFGITVGGTTVNTIGADNDNLTIQNNAITTAAYGINVTGFTTVSAGANDNLSITSNIVGPASSGAGNIGLNGIFVINAVAPNISGNTVQNVSSTTATVTGIQINGGVTNPTISQNVIRAIQTSTTSVTAYGLVIGTGSTGAQVTGNAISAIYETSTSGYPARGIYVNTGNASSNVTVANNTVTDIQSYSDPDLTLAFSPVGIYLDGSTGGINLYFNSVNLFGAHPGLSGATLQAALYVKSTVTGVNLRNNVLVNSYDNSTSSTEKSYSIFSSAANTAFTTINYNDYFVSGTPGVLGNIAATDRANLAAIQTGFGQNANSIVADPLYNSATNLQPQTGSPVIGAGVFGTGITTDFTGATRTNPPSMGAYDAALDSIGPAITYSALGNTLSTGDRTLTIGVTDTSGVPTTGLGLPVIYYNKNAGGYVSTQCVFASGSSFNCDLLATSMGGLTTGDTVSYYVAAQDNLGNVSVSPSTGASGLTANPPAASTPPTTPNSYQIAAAVTGTLSVNAGGGGNATSLTNTGGIFQQINNGVVTGNITINIDSDLTGETGTVALNQFASPFTVTIKPNGASRTITGTGSGGILIKLNGADNVTIDGSTSGGTDRSLTLINPNTANGVGTLFVASLGTGAGATGDTIKNCIIKAGSIGSTTVFNFGIFVGDTTGAAAGADNDNLTIQNNQIFTARTGIQATGTAGGVLDNLNINNNLIGDNTPANSIGRIGINASVVSNASVASNTIKNISIAADTLSSFGIIMTTSTGSSIASNTITGITATGTSVLQPTGISVSTATTGLSITGNTIDGIVNSGSNVGPQGITVGAAVTNSSVTRNNISNITYTGTSGYGGKGIEIGTGSASSNVTVANNFVSNIKGDCWSAGSNILDTVMGIRVIGSTGGVNIYNNSVSLASGSFVGNTQAGTISAALYIASTATTLDIRNNILTNNLDNSVETTDKNYAFYSDAANTAFTDINFNDYWVPASTVGGPQVLGFLTSDRILLTDIQTATGKDAASISSDPLFTSVTNLHIASGSPARNAGATIATVVDDIDGNARPQESVYEIGADEYVDSTAPETTIDSNPTNPSNSASATFTFSGTDSLAPEAVASFDCDLDGGGFATCTSPKNYPSLSDGSHTFQVRAKDAGGNVDPTPASYTWVIDATAPNTSITANPTNPSNSTSASFSFNGTDGSGTGIASFQCQIDGGGFSACTSPANYPGLSEGSHTFQVMAIDNAGNVDASPAIYTWVIDTVAPDTNITANPTNPSNSANASFSFNGSDPGGSGVAGFQCQIDGGGYSACTSPANYPGLSDGSHTFNVRAVDAAGNTDASPASYTWVVDTTRPTIIPDAPFQTHFTNSTSATFTFHGTDSGSGLAGFICSLDGAAFTPCTSPVNYTGLSVGLHTFDAKSVDNAGNLSLANYSSVWEIDQTPPETTIDSNPTNPSNSSSATFTFSGTDTPMSPVPPMTPPVTFQCALDSAPFTTCTSPQSYSSLSDGSHTFQVRSVDLAGNLDPTPASYTWVINTVAPETTIDSNPPDPSNSSTAMFTFSGTDSLTAGKGSGASLVSILTFACQIDGGGYSTCTSPVTYPGLSDGSHTFQVKATDLAGNTDPTPASYTWVVDATAPTTSITANPTNPSNSATGAFSFNGGDGAGSGVASFACQIDGGGYSTCTSPASYPGLSDGSHTFDVRATDAAGNTDATPASFTWTIDTALPVIAPYTPLSNTTSTGTRAFSVTVTDNLAVATVVVHYSINGGSYLTAACAPSGPPDEWTCTLPGNSTGTAVAYYVSATDTAANSAEGPSSLAPNLYTVGAAAVPAGTYSTLSMRDGSSIGGNVTVIASLELSGIVTTGVSTITLNCGAVIEGAGPASYVNGNLQVNFCATGTFTFPVGTAADGSRPDGDQQPEGFAGEYSPMTATITALGVNPSSLKVSVDDNFMLGMVQTSAISRLWSVEETGNITADMTFRYLDQDINGSEAGYKVFKRSGGFTTEQTPNSNNPAANTVTVLNVSNFSQWTAGAAVTTTAGASISGRVTTASGNGIRNAFVTISGNSLPTPIRVQTGSLGYYFFENLAAGETYIVQVGAKRFRFQAPSRVVALQDSLTDVDFVANPQE